MSLLAGCTLTFLALSGLMAAVDAALLSVTRPEVAELVLHRRRGSRKLWELKQQLTRAVVVVVIVTNTINVLGPILVSHLAFETYGADALGIVTIVLTFGTIVFSEIVPKALGAHYAPTLSRWAAPVVRVLQFGLYPLVLLLEELSEVFTRGARRIGTEDQIRSLVMLGRRAGYIERDESRLIRRVFVLNDRLAGDIMTPLRDVISIEAATTVQEAAEIVHREGFSRYPVFGQTVHDVRGTAIGREVLQALARGRGGQPLRTVWRPPLIVPSERPADELLMLFRDERQHLAVVQDQGRTVGIVTLEDVLEELVGEIEDEKDAASETA